MQFVFGNEGREETAGGNERAAHREHRLRDEPIPAIAAYGFAPAGVPASAAARAERRVFQARIPGARLVKMRIGLPWTRATMTDEMARRTAQFGGTSCECHADAPIHIDITNTLPSCFLM